MLNLKLYLICVCLSTVASDYNDCKASDSGNSNSLIVYINNYNTTDGNIIKNCAVMEPYKEAEYLFQWIVGDKQIEYCERQTGYDNPQCIASFPKSPNVIGIPKCIVTMEFNNKYEGDTRSCTVSMKNFIIGKDYLHINECNNVLKVGLGRIHEGQSPSCYIFSSQNITAISVEWLLDNKPYRTCDGNKMQNYGSYYKCDFIENAVGNLQCVVNANLWQTTAGVDHHKAQCSSHSFILPKTKKPLRENAKSEILGYLNWNLDPGEKSTKLAGENVHVWCHIQQCKAGYYYTIDWFIKSSKNKKDKKIFKSCNNMQTDNGKPLNCASDETLPMEEGGVVFCRASVADTKNLAATADSDTLYTVRIPKIEVRHNNDDSYTCSVNRFDPYYLTWTSSEEKLTAKDYKDCSNTTHSCAQLHRQFTTDTTVSCVYGNENITIKQKQQVIEKKTPTTTISSIRPSSTTESTTVPQIIENTPVTSDKIHERGPTLPPSKQNNSEPEILSTTTPSTIIATTTITSTTALSPTTSENHTEAGLNATKDVSIIVTIVGVVITIVGNTLAFGYYCARRRKCCQKDSKEGSQNSDRNESQKGCGEEPTYSVPHKWLSRPAKKEPTVIYTSLDLMPSASWAGKEDTAYVEIVGVEKPFYDEVGQAPIYSNLETSKMASEASEPEYSNALFKPEVEYAEVLPKSYRKKK